VNTAAKEGAKSANENDCPGPEKNMWSELKVRNLG